MTKYKQRERATDYMLWIKTLPCVVPDCNTGLPIEAAHVGDHGSSDRKCCDHEVLPLCSPGFSRLHKQFSNEDHHREGRFSEHKMGARFWKYHSISRDELMAHYRRVYLMLQELKYVD